ncbi:hypothetical protein CT676_43530 [Bradyrhizobium sp. MOS001]|uniref:hypothetical protein n=1 Tax=Bradyrhizobium sp. 2TAF36 TaxID=3233016 RepID=UPI00107501DD|nr:hypothetical protein CT676_43530 [Bradyrhizobium sp. MOS001]
MEVLSYLWATRSASKAKGELRQRELFPRALSLLIRDLATEPKKRDLFTKLAEHLTILADEVERAIAAAGPDLKRKE